MLSLLKPSIDKTTQKLVTPFENINPNVLTLVGIVPSIGFFLSVITHNYFLAIIFYIGNVVDLLDGAVAKRFHKVTPFGGFLDSTFDRISDFLIISSFGFAHIVSWTTVLLLIFFSYLVSYARSRAELASGGKISVAVGLIERTERLALIFVALVLYFYFPTFTFLGYTLMTCTFLILILLSAVTFLQRVWYAYKHL